MPKIKQMRLIPRLVMPLIFGVLNFSTPVPHAELKAQQANEKQEALKKIINGPNGKLRWESKAVRGANGLPECLAEVWSVEEERLLHQFTFPGVDHKFRFSPDGSTMISTEQKGNLALVTTLRAFDMESGEELLLGAGPGDCDEKVVFSRDGTKVAAVGVLGMGFWPREIDAETGGLCLARIRVWNLAEKTKPIDLDFALSPRESRAFTRLPQSRDEVEETIRRILPSVYSFSPTGDRIISETEAGFLTVHNLRSGKKITKANILSVNTLTASMLITLQLIPAEVTQFKVELHDQETPLLVARRADSFWQATRQGSPYGSPFKIEADKYVIKERRGERKKKIFPLLGLNENTDWGHVEEIRHPLGILKIETKMQSIEFELQYSASDELLGETLKRGVVSWGD